MIGNVLWRLFWVNMPAYHDETFYFDGARAVLRNNLIPWVNFSGYKGPVTYEPVAFLMGFWGVHRWWARLLIYICSSASLWLIYRLGKKLFGELIGLASAILLFLLPLFMAHSLLYTDALPLTMMFLLTLNYYFEGKRSKYFFCSILLVLTKETAIFIPFFLFILGGGWPIVLVPTIGLGIWMLLNKLILGFYLLPYSVGLLWSNGWQIRLEQGLMNWGTVWWLMVVLGVVVAKLQNKKIKMKVVSVFLGMYLFYNLVYGVTYFNQRYLLVVMPLVIMVFVYLLKLFGGNRGLKVGVSVMALCLILSQMMEWQWGRPVDGGDDLRILKIISQQRETAKYLSDNYADKIIQTGWPLANYINDPFYGYVEKSIKITSYNCNGKKSSVDSLAEVVVLSRMDCDMGVVLEPEWKLVKSWQKGTVQVYEK